MYILIDATNNQALARHDSYMALAALAYIQFANVDTAVLPLEHNRAFTIFDKESIHLISKHAGQHQPASTPYNELVSNMRKWLLTAPHLFLPFPVALLVGQAHSIAPSDDRPYFFDPQAEEPSLHKSWRYPPQRNRKRSDSSQSVHFASGAAPPPLVLTPPASPRTAPSAAKTPKRTPSTAPRTSAAGARPKAGTSTGRVWDIADEVSARLGLADKVVRKEVIELCAAEGINASTASVQFGKWKNQTN